VAALGAVGFGLLLGGFTSTPYLIFAGGGLIGIAVFMLHGILVRPGWIYAADKLAAERLGRPAILTLLKWMQDHPPTAKARFIVGPGMPNPERRIAVLSQEDQHRRP
jgi:hypothetical protein